MPGEALPAVQGGPVTLVMPDIRKFGNFKHGHYSAEAIAHRRKVGALLRAAREVVRQADEGRR